MEPPCDKLDLSIIPAVGPVPRPWREGTLTRATELHALSKWVLANPCPPGSPPDSVRENPQALVEAINIHLKAARAAAEGMKPSAIADRSLWFRLFHWSYWFRTASLIERAMSNLDAAETLLLDFAPPGYLLGQMPAMLNHVQRHLPPTDPRRQEFERIAQRLGVKDPDHPLINKPKEPSSTETLELILIGRSARKLRVDDRIHLPLNHIKTSTQVEAAGEVIRQERGKIVTAVRGACSEALREQLRLRSFRNILIATIAALMLLAGGVALLGWLFPMSVPLCFQPSLASGETVIACPTAFSNRIPPDAQPGPVLIYRISEAVRPWDHATVELVGLVAAAVVATIRIRNIRGSSEAPDLPVLLALLKLPMGALTAFLGLLLVRGGFVPGLSALDSPAQILSWALVFGFAQQLFTRLVDQQGQTVLNSVRAADRPPSDASLGRP